MADQHELSPLEKKRHSAAHILAIAVLKHFPTAKLGIGPTIENGFYYDFDINARLTPEDLPKLEKTMKDVIKQKLGFERTDLDVAAATKFFEDQPFKMELIADLEKDDHSTVSLYKTGEFTDLCRGGHVDSTNEINPDGLKLMSIAGAYWRGDENRQMLQRIYGVLFETKEELDAHLAQFEEAAKRDHRKLGQELDLFTFSDLVGSGLPLWTPKGTLIRNELQNALIRISQKYDMLPVTIPHLAKIDLYKKSGHAEKFDEELFRVVSHYGTEFVMKPVNCPHHTQIYASKPRSYRDLPLRYMESTMQYRDEKPGEIGGLTRVRSITVDDGHIFCRVDQIKEEATNIANIIKEFYSSLGMYGNHWVSLSVRDSEHPEKYIGDEEDWVQAEQMLQQVSDELGLDAKRMEGEAALYGPKLDFMFKDSMGKERQLSTIQIDFAMPKRFDLTYADSDGGVKHPVMIHRAILGSYERFMAILIEHFAGAFPTWLSPVQVAVIPVSDKFNNFATDHVVKPLREAGIRVEMNDANESVGKKIRYATTQKVPYMVVVGEKEVESGELAVRSRDVGDLGSLAINELISRIVV